MNCTKKNQYTNQLKRGKHNQSMLQYVLESRKNKPICSEKLHTPFQRPVGLAEDGHVPSETVDTYSSLLYSELTHDSVNQPLPSRKIMKKLYALPKKNIVKEDQLLLGKTNTLTKAELTDLELSNRRYQMSNFFPVQQSNNSSLFIDNQNFGTNRGGVATRLDRYKK